MGDEESLDDWTDAGHTEWEFLVASRFAGMTASDVERQLQLCCCNRKLHSGHALKHSEILELRNLLKVCEDVSDEIIALNTDYLCIVVGQHAYAHVGKQMAARRNEFYGSVVQPLISLQRKLLVKDNRKEFLQADGVLSGDALAEIEDALASFLKKSNDHVAWLEGLITKGKDHLADLKLFHVKTADMLLEFLNPNAVPRRGSIGDGGWFHKYVKVLARPIFKEDEHRDGFHGATVTFAQEWTSKFKELEQNIR